MCNSAGICGTTNCVPEKRGMVCNTPETWAITILVPDYQPDELCVQVTCDGSVEVRGEKVPTCPDACSPTLQRFAEKYCIPPEVDTATIKWEYTPECRLIISACKKKKCCCC